MKEFDYIVVGGGAAGCVLANRLTEDGDTEVLLLEAGGARIPPEVDVPAAWFQLLGSPIDWGYQSIPQPGLADRVTREPRGRALGGSSNLYIMMHVRGHPSDFDNWAYQGAAGWSYDEVLPYFTRLESPEDRTGPTAERPGPQRVTNAGRHDPNPASRAFIDACTSLGFPELEDFNAGAMYGTAWHQLDIADGRRHGALAAYLEPALTRPNLTVLTGARATRLLFDGTDCAGVELLGDAQPSDVEGRAVGDGRVRPAEPGVQRVRARAEVIVAAGAIESPKLLMLSGLGHPDELADLDIPVVERLPGVGRNFHNHVLTGLIAEAVEEVPAPHLNLSESALFTTSRPGLPAPDIQLAFVHVPFDIIVGEQHPNAVSVLPGVVRPMSRGWVKLSSSDPRVKPLVNPNYLSDHADVERLVQGVRLARDVVQTKAFARWHKQELMPGPAVDTDRALEEFVRNNADSYHHQAGSCRMGIDDLSVVDPELRVHGVSRLRVADASVMPAVPSGNPHAAVLMIAERAADLVRQAA
jgi:choline dehydrogenase